MSPRLGEREIIKTLIGIYGKQANLPLGFDDDVAALPINKKLWMILKSDMLVGSTDVPPEMSLQQAARKAVVATVSDFAAKGVRPRALMVSLGLPGSLGGRDIRRIGAGLERASQEYHCPIVGGDTSESNDLVIDCMGAGLADPKKLVRRDGARPGDVVAVTGTFGKPALGVRLLLAGKKADSRLFRSVLKSTFLPEARLVQGLALAGTGCATSSIDSSDGLAWSLYEIARNSRVRIHLETIPTAPEVEQLATLVKDSPTRLALYGGEEYELVVTVKREGWGKAKNMVPSLTPIGRVMKGAPLVTGESRGRTFRVEAKGWEHFRSKN